jgi:putative transposase
MNMAYDSKIHHRRSIRLKGYDYSQAGLYFITMCVQNKDYLFGNIVDEQMITNDAGKMVEKWYLELENKFPDIECGEYVVMPNHFHCIIENNGKGNPNIHKESSPTVGADLCVCPNHTCEPSLGEHAGSPLHHVIQWFKTMSTNEYIRSVKISGWQRFNSKLWQRDYWEHIIRDQKSFDEISDYIINNPINWDTDKLK